MSDSDSRFSDFGTALTPVWWGEDMGVSWDNASDALKERFALTRLFWFYRMVVTGGPDGSDLDTAVSDEAREAAEWWGPRLEEMAERAQR
jgi:hypothetical protein